MKLMEIITRLRVMAVVTPTAWLNLIYVSVMHGLGDASLTVVLIAIGETSLITAGAIWILRENQWKD